MAEDTTTTKAGSEDEKASKIEILIAIMLGVTTILGALAAYFAALWGGEMQSSYSQSITQTNHANTIYLEALSDLSAFEMDDLRDDIIYSEWKENTEKGDTEDAAYFFSKLSEGFQKDLSDNPGDVSEYEKQQVTTFETIQGQFKEADDIHGKAEELMKKGGDANKYGDDFTLCTVLFTIVLFFLGLASLKTKSSVQKIYLGIACVVLVLSIIRMVTVPFPL